MVDTMQTWRDAAMATFRAVGLPHDRQEAWKYTDVSAIHQRMGADWRKENAPAAAPFLPEFYPKIDGLDAYTIIFFQGRIHVLGLALPAGVDLVPWSTMDQTTACEDLPKVQPDAPLFHAFDALNAGLMDDGVCLRVAAGVLLDKPLYILHLHDDTAHSHVRHRVHLGESSKASIIHHDVALTGEHARLRTSHYHCYLETASTLDHTRVQEFAANDWHFGRLHVEQQQASHFDAHAAELGGEKIRMDICVQLQQASAYCAVHGLFLLHDAQHVDHHIHINHYAPDCSSRQVYRSVLADHSHGVFNGKVHVHRHASGTDAEQHSDNLLLSKNAEIDTKPELEIDHDNVTCSHGATVGQLNADHLFYLRSRGLSEAMSRDILVFAFADALLAVLPDRHIRRYIESIAFNKIPHGTDLLGLLAK
ncbi:MAG: Fe-S cluster assembly protein SufD [Mariprofundaceae bacterium]|nr:Fe-S cluster assembly protein SufD [Mariprofundaceae bacterium]